MTNKFIYKNMGSNNEYRPEQMTVASILREDRKYNNFDIKTEYPVPNLKFEGKKYGAILDIALVPKKEIVQAIYLRYANKQEPIAVRMMGEIHEKSRKSLQDADQAMALQNARWFIHDLWYNYATCFWKPERFTKKELEGFLFNFLKQYIYPEFLVV